MAAPEEPPTTPVGALRPRRGVRTIDLAVGGPIAPADVWGLCERVRALVAGADADLVVCDVGGLAGPDAACVDALARMQLTARRLGCEIRLRHGGAELHDLLVLAGLGDVVPPLRGATR